MRGTLLNTATVTGGGLIGIFAGQFFPESFQSIALTGLGLVTLGLGIKQFLTSQNVILVAISLVLGGLLGELFQIHQGLAQFTDWAQSLTGSQSDAAAFQQKMLMTSVLYCIGPMTLLGCLQDALEKKIELLAIKSTLDGIVAIFAAIGPGGLGVLATAVVVLIFQGGLTLSARFLSPFAKDEEFMRESTALGGLLLVSIGFGLLGIKSIQTETYLPALLLTPVFITLQRKFASKRAAA